IRDFHVTGVQTCALPISLPIDSDACLPPLPPDPPPPNGDTDDDPRAYRLIPTVGAVVESIRERMASSTGPLCMRPFARPATVSRPICMKTLDGELMPRRFFAALSASCTTPFAAFTAALAIDLMPLIRPLMMSLPALTSQDTAPL